MSLYIEGDPERPHSGILTPHDVVGAVTQDKEVTDYLDASNLSQVIKSIIHQLYNPNHEPLPHDLVSIQKTFPELVSYLERIIRSYFQEPAGKAVLNEYLSHYSAGQTHPVLAALNTIYEPLSPHRQPIVASPENAMLLAFEEELIKRADTGFRGIDLLSLRKI